MVPDEKVSGDSWIRRRQRRKGIGGRRRWGGSELAATPSLEWKLGGGDSARGSGGPGGGAAAAVSARKLAASLWQLAEITNGSGRVRWQYGLFDRLRLQFCSSRPIPKFATEGVTKWDYYYSKPSDDVIYFCDHVKFLERCHREIETTSVASARRAELFKAGICSKELEAEQVKKLDEEGASWIRTEREKIYSIFKQLEDGVRRERKNCQKMDTANSKLLLDIAEAKLSARKIKQNLEKEKKEKELLEDLCNKLAKEIEGKKAEIGALRDQQKRVQEEVEEERKMLQIAEVWREERAQMKLVDAKLFLEDKYSEMNNLISDLQAFLRKSTTDVNLMSKSEVLRHPCMLPKSDNMCTIVKDSHTSDRADYESQKSDISSVSLKQSNKSLGSSACKPQRMLSRNKDKCKSVPINRNGQLSNGSISSTVTLSSPPQRALGKGERNPHVVRAMRGHIEWPRGIQRHRLAANLSEAKLESQKMLLRNVLKQRS